MNIADVFFKAQLDDGQLLVDAKKTGDKMGQTMGSSLSSTLKKAAAGAALGGLFTSAIEGATRFEDQLRTINTVAKVSDEQLSAIGDDIQQLSRDSGKTTDDLTAGFYDLVSAGVPAGEAMKVLKDSSILATGALGTTSEAVDLVTSALGAYGLSADKSTRVTDIFAQAVADGKTTVADLAGGISQVAPIAASAGVSLEEVAAATAIMTLKGDTASQAMTRIKNAISALLTPNATLNEIQKRTGINFAELAKDKGLAVALEELRKATKGNNEEFAKALGSSEALTLAFSVTGDNAGAMATELGKVQEGADKGGVALEQYGEKSKSAAEQGKRLVANIQTFLQDVGGPFVSTMGPAVFALNQMGQAFGAGGIAAKAFGAILGGSLAGKLKNLEIGTRLQTLWIKGMTKIGDPLASAIGGVWQRVASSSIVGGAVAKAGSLAATAYLKALIAGDIIGGALSKAWTASGGADLAAKLAGSRAGAAYSLALKLGLVLGIAAIADAIEPALGDIAAQIGRALPFGEERSSLGNDIQNWIANAPWPLGTKGQPDWAGGERATREGLDQALVDPMNTALAAAAAGAVAASSLLPSKLTPAINDGLERTAAGIDPKPITAGVTDIMAFALKTSGKIAAGVSKATGNRLGAAIAQGINEKRDAVDDAWFALVEGLKTQISPTMERAKLLGKLASSELIAGLRSKDPAVRAQAAATKQVIIDRLKELGANAKNIGKSGMAELAKAMRSKDPDVRAAARAIKNSASKVAPSKSQATTWGKAIGQGLVNGLNAMAAAVGGAAGNLANIIAAYLQTHSPSELGPLSEDGGPEGWGKLIGDAISRGLNAHLPNLTDALGGSLQVPSLSLANAVPALGGVPVAARAQGYQAVAGGVVNNFYNTANVEGLVKATSTLEIARELGRSARSGLFAPRKVETPA